MTEESEYRPGLTALELAHEKLDATLREQSKHSEHLDRKAARTLQASLTFSGVAAATVFYLTRLGDPAMVGVLDTPLTDAALAFGLVSVLCSITTSSHTAIETAMQPADVRAVSRYGRKEFLVLLVETYSAYARRNDRRLSIDTTLLSVAQVSLVLAVLCTVGSVARLAGGTAGSFDGVARAVIVGGILGGVLAVWALLGRDGGVVSD